MAFRSFHTLQQEQVLGKVCPAWMDLATLFTELTSPPQDLIHASTTPLGRGFPLHPPGFSQEDRDTNRLGVLPAGTRLPTCEGHTGREPR
jgi:hypothetical protein